MTRLLPFHTELSNAWKLFLQRWGSAVIVQLPTLVPGALMLPLLNEYLAAVETGADGAVVLQASPYAWQFVAGFIILLLVGVFVSTATGILFAAREKISLWRALWGGAARYVPVLYTSILSALALLVSLIPVFALNYGYAKFAQAGAPVTDNALVVVDAIMLIALFALFIPAAIVMVWVMYAPLAVALKAAPAGFTAIMFSKHLVHRHIWQIIWRLCGAMVLFQIISASVVYLPYLSYIVPFVLSIVILAFFVGIYKELHEGQA